MQTGHVLILVLFLRQILNSIFKVQDIGFSSLFPEDLLPQLGRFLLNPDFLGKLFYFIFSLLSLSIFVDRVVGKEIIILVFLSSPSTPQKIFMCFPLLPVFQHSEKKPRTCLKRKHLKGRHIEDAHRKGRMGHSPMLISVYNLTWHERGQRN